LEKQITANKIKIDDYTHRLESKQKGTTEEFANNIATTFGIPPAEPDSPKPGHGNRAQPGYLTPVALEVFSIRPAQIPPLNRTLAPLMLV